MSGWRAPLRLPVTLVLVASLASAMGSFGGVAASATPVVVTAGADAMRTSWYPDEAGLTPGVVSGGTFGQLFSTPVLGQVYGQPLVSNGTLFVTTEDDQIYGLDPETGAVKWTRNVGSPWHAADIGCADLVPNVGITATPVIDPSGTGTAYFTAKSYASGSSGPAR